ncbi:Fibrinogen-like protein A [Holothuria leucospilota]|uniref:Fibrinogen-like protein A n=1 Tax=Holothuria leucospilota TaxID=206669 RepID=A0A9Q1BW63_HOLLE|nr:Fibrinogen-like protein A [Holothuria leucospilota]
MQVAKSTSLKKTSRSMSQMKIIHFCFCLCWTSWSALGQQLNNYPTSESKEGVVGSSFFYYQQQGYPRDCSEVRNQCSTHNVSGVHLIKPDGYPEPFEVYCDNTDDSGGWTVIHRLQDGSVLFNRNWTEYKNGFGFMSQEFWIGNEKLSFLTNQGPYELRIDIKSADDMCFYLTYNKFRISDEYSDYKIISVGEYNGSEEEINRFLCPSNSEGRVYLSQNCSSRCSCTSGHFSCDDTYQCNPNAVCEERNDVIQCYCDEGYTGDGVNCTIATPPSDCQDIYDRVSTESGVYKIKPTTWQGEPFDVYCNMTDGGGWTVFQRRVDGSQDFFLYWSDYKNGFGTPSRELWLGNDKLHSLTSQGNYQLRIDFVNRDGAPYYAKHSSFRISNENDKYRLSVGSYSGNAGGDMSYFNGQAFTTRDRDNDPHGGNCATHTSSPSATCGTACAYNAGWWLNSCGYQINAPYGSNCLSWYNLPGKCNVKYTEMKVRPV